MFHNTQEKLQVLAFAENIFTSQVFFNFSLVYERREEVHWPRDAAQD